MSWTTERKETAKKLWLTGYSSSQIAAELGNGITRNAVIGKIHRMGLGGRVKAEATTRIVPRAAPKQLPMQKPVISREKSKEIVPVVARPVEEMLAEDFLDRTPPALPSMTDTCANIPGCLLVTFADMGDRACRWDMGKDKKTLEKLYCGARTETTRSPYCAFHSRMSYKSSSGNNKPAGPMTARL